MGLIAEETGCCNVFTEPDNARTSEPVPLTAGKKYFIRLVYKEGGGGDYGQVAWRKEGDTTPASSLTPISGKYLSSAIDLPAPAEGKFVTQTPAPGAKSVVPNASIKIVHTDGKAEWTSANVTLKIDGVAVTPTIVKEANELSIAYQPSSLYASASTHTITLVHPDPSGQTTTTEWSFTASTYGGPAKDQVKSYPALILGSAKFTADAGGRSAKAGDYGMDLTTKGGPVQVIDAACLAAVNAACAQDELSVSMWIKKYDIADSSAFWFFSPSQSRVFQAHTPWSDNNVYFDTAGCCDASTQRLSGGIDTFIGYTGDIEWWTNNWHLFVFTKKADQKNVYIDGEPFLYTSNTGTLSSDISRFNIGGEAGATSDNNPMHAIVDDFAIYSKELTQANVTTLAGGAKPSALATAAGLVAYWDFDDPSRAPADPQLKVSLSGGKVVISWASGTLVSSSTVKGAYAPVAGATSPFSVTPGAGQATFYQIQQ